MILQQEQIRLNYIEEISIKNAGKNKEIVQISKNVLPYIIVTLSEKSLAMITHFLQMSVNENMIVLCPNMLHKIEKFMLR